MSELEMKIADVRYQLMLKGTELDFKKQNFKSDLVGKIETLQNEVAELRKTLKELTKTLLESKFSYYVSYSVTTINIWNGENEKNTYNEILWSDRNVNLDFPGNWDEEKDNEVLFDLCKQIKNRYDEVTLLRARNT